MNPFITLCFFLVFHSVLSQTEISPPEEKKKSSWGITSIVELNGIDLISDQDTNNFASYLSDVSSLRIGGFYELGNTNSEINIGVGGIEVLMKYKFHKNKFIRISGKSLHFDNLVQNNNYGIVNKMSFTEYTGSFGVDFTLKSYNTIEFSISSGRISSNQYESYEIEEEYNKALRIVRNEILKSTMIYGAELRYNIDSNNLFLFSKNCSYFISASYRFNNKSNFHREVTVEEWIPDNVVYNEKTVGTNYKIDVFSIKLGIIW